MKIQDQPPTASAQDPKPTVAQLKARQEMILQHLQNHSNNRDSKTLVLKKNCHKTHSYAELQQGDKHMASNGVPVCKERLEFPPTRLYTVQTLKFYGMDQSEFGMMLSSELGIVSLI